MQTGAREGSCSIASKIGVSLKYITVPLAWGQESYLLKDLLQQVLESNIKVMGLTVPNLTENSFHILATLLVLPDL